MVLCKFVLVQTNEMLMYLQTSFQDKWLTILTVRSTYLFIVFFQYPKFVHVWSLFRWRPMNDMASEITSNWTVFYQAIEPKTMKTSIFRIGDTS